MLTVCKEFEFHAAHHLPCHDGKCKNVHGHGYVLEVEVAGGLREYGPDTGMIIDFSDLKRIVNEEVIEKLDHKNLNDLFENPTAEVMVNWIAGVLSLSLQVIRVRLYETRTSYAEWKE